MYNRLVRRHDAQVFQQRELAYDVQELVRRRGAVGVPYVEIEVSQSVGENAKIFSENLDEQVGARGDESESVQLGD